MNKAHLSDIQKRKKIVPMLNKGEKGEINIIKKLFFHRNDRSWVFENLSYDSRIALVNPKDYDRWITHGISFINHEEDIQKTGGLFKSDVVLFFYDIGIIKRVSIKCFDGGAPTILNHTPRTAKCWKKLAPPDAIVAKMNRMRSCGEAGEDIALERLNLDDLEMNHLKKIVTYFVSMGSGARHSSVPCDSILYAKNNEIFHFYPSVSEYVENLLTEQKMVLSIRNKGMSKKALADKTWMYQEPDGKLKGALNIRLTGKINF